MGVYLVTLTSGLVEVQPKAPDVPPTVGTTAASWRPYSNPAWAVGVLGFGGFTLAAAPARADERALRILHRKRGAALAA